MKLRIRIVYGICSYGVAVLLLLLPLFSAQETTALARIVPFLGGAFLLSGAVLTDFELGMTRMMRFRDTVTLTIFGCLLVLLSVIVLSYGPLMWIVVGAAAGQCIISLLAYQAHAAARHHIA